MSLLYASLGPIGTQADHSTSKSALRKRDDGGSDLSNGKPSDDGPGEDAPPSQGKAPPSLCRVNVCVIDNEFLSAFVEFHFDALFSQYILFLFPPITLTSRMPTYSSTHTPTHTNTQTPQFHNPKCLFLDEEEGEVEGEEVEGEGLDEEEMDGEEEQDGEESMPENQKNATEESGLIT